MFRVKSFCWMWAVALALLLQAQIAACKRDKAVFCSVCRALVDEVNARIEGVDPSKKVKVGSYRVDPHGNQKLQEVQYAKSDMHLAEILEDVCETMKDYALVQSEITKKQAVVRTKSRAGKEMDVSNYRFNAQMKMTFQSYCEEVIEEHEGDMMRLFKQEDPVYIESQLCGELSNACTEDELAEPVLKLEEKREMPKITSFHQIDPDGSAPKSIDGVETIDDIRNKILEAGRQTQDDDTDDPSEDTDGSEKDEL